MIQFTVFPARQGIWVSVHAVPPIFFDLLFLYLHITASYLPFYHTKKRKKLFAALALKKENDFFHTLLL
ncbi:hypothetical protein [uncultured Ruminococcus sp.]|uniref:hypothetical protein n=1 Tax=Ruminococcus sp. TaxID=41978 RepID=UPI0015B0A6EC|nr:hypothetical protein [uncultured Ruminococcus sp.]